MDRDVYVVHRASHEPSQQSPSQLLSDLGGMTDFPSHKMDECKEWLWMGSRVWRGTWVGSFPVSFTPEVFQGHKELWHFTFLTSPFFCIMHVLFYEDSFCERVTRRNFIIVINTVLRCVLACAFAALFNLSLFFIIKTWLMFSSFIHHSSHHGKMVQFCDTSEFLF